MNDRAWMIYGATGFTGTILAEEAVRRGHTPILAGRSASRLAPLADRLGLRFITADLDNAEELARAVEGVDLLLHAAGPFIGTAAPMLRACVAGRTNYLDITGEVPVFRTTFSFHEQAVEREIALISGCGFDVVPTDCLAGMLHARLPDAVSLDIAIDATTSPTAGTIVSTLMSAPDGGAIRRNGRLIPYPLGKGGRKQRFPGEEASILPLPLGDLESAYRQTGIPDITTYLALPGFAYPLLRVMAPLLRPLLGVKPVRNGAAALVRKFVKGPDAAMMREGRSLIWGRVRNAAGEEVEEWLETIEPYRFTALAGVQMVEHVLREHPVGALTPAQGAGAEFVMGIEGTKRYSKLPA